MDVTLAIQRKGKFCEVSKLTVLDPIQIFFQITICCRIINKCILNMILMSTGNSFTASNIDDSQIA